MKSSARRPLRDGMSRVAIHRYILLIAATFSQATDLVSIPGQSPLHICRRQWFSETRLRFNALGKYSFLDIVQLAHHYLSLHIYSTNWGVRGPRCPNYAHARSTCDRLR